MRRASGPRVATFGRTVLAFAAVLALAGCLNATPETGRNYQYNEGRNVDAGDLAVRNVIVRLGEDGEAQVAAAIWNGGSQEDRLQSVSVNGTPARLSGDMTLAPRTSMLLGGSGTAQASAVAADLDPGRVATVSMTFSRAPQIEVTTLVMGGATESPEAA